MTLVLAPRTDEQPYLPQKSDSPIKPEILDISDISTPPMGVSMVDEWQTFSDVGAFESNEP